MTNPAASIDDGQSQSALEWLEANQRLLTIAAVVIVLAAGVFWLVQRNRADRAISADKGLETARRDMALGNLQLAQSDLGRLVKDYSGTYSGTEGAMMLAQLSYDQGKFADGMQTLHTALGSAPAPMLFEINDLIGAGSLGLNKPLDAAKSYEAAAAATTYAGERANERSKAASAYRSGGDLAKAKAIWTDLSTDYKNPGIAAEAKVRLGEVEAAAAGKG